MERFFGEAHDTLGNIIPSVTVRVRLAGTANDATIYSDNSYTPLANPFTSNTNGTYQFYARNGRYDIILSKTGVTFVDDNTANTMIDDTMSVLSPAQITSNQNDYAPTNGLNASVWRLSSDAARTITGITAGNSGQVLTIYNVGSFALTFSNESGSSSLANRILTGTGSDTSISADGCIVMVYDASTSRWRVRSAVAGTVVAATGIFTSPGAIVGLKLTNNGTDPTNDIDIATGAATSNDATLTDRDSMLLSSALTKQLDVNWAVGTNQGGLDTGVVGNNTYHVFLIKRTDTGVVDVLFSTSASAPTMPASYNKKRRIGSIIRSGGAIVTFVQDGDMFKRTATILDVDATNPGTAAVTRTLSVPTGIRVEAMGNVRIAQSTSAGVNPAVYLSDLSVTDEAPSQTAAPLGTATARTADGQQAMVPYRVYTNTSAQIRSRLSASDANTILRMATTGWIDRREQDS